MASGIGNGVPFRSFSVLIVEVSMVKSDRKSDPVQSTKTPSSQIPQERKICSIRSWKIGNFNIIYLFFRLFNITVCSRKQKRTSCSPPKGQRILNGPDRRGSGPFIETDARFEVIISEPGANDWTEEDVGDEGSNISPLLMVDATKTVGRYLIFFIIFQFYLGLVQKLRPDLVRISMRIFFNYSKESSILIRFLEVA